MPKSGDNCLERLSNAVATVARVGREGAAGKLAPDLVVAVSETPLTVFTLMMVYLGEKRLVDVFHTCDASVLGIPGHPSDLFSDAIETIPQVCHPWVLSESQSVVARTPIRMSQINLAPYSLSLSVFELHPPV